MKKLVKEYDELLKQYGNTKLNEDELVLYEHSKKNIVPALLYYIGGFGAHRFYMGDIKSKIYGIIWFIISLIYICYKGIANSYSGIDLTPALIIIIIITVMYLVDAFLIIPTIKRNNLLIKKRIIEGEITPKTIDFYWLWDSSSIIYAMVSGVIWISSLL